MKIHELLDSPSKWTKGCLAADANGEIVGEHDPSARCWCLIGAIYKCYEPESHEKVWRALDRVRAKIGEEYNIGDWNDNHEFKDVQKLCKELDI
jgi:hypothetical protein